MQHWFGIVPPLGKERSVEGVCEQLQGSKALHLLDSDSILPLHLDTRQLGIDDTTNVADLDSVLSMTVAVVASKATAAPHEHVGFNVSLYISRGLYLSICRPPGAN